MRIIVLTSVKRVNSRTTQAHSRILLKLRGGGWDERGKGTTSLVGEGL